MTTAISSISSTQSALQVNGVNSVIFDQYGIVSGIGKNKARNGDFSINQMGVSGTVTLAASAYGHDMWKAGASGCTYTFATALNVTTITISAGSLIQVIEGIYLQSGTYCLGWGGTSQGKIDAGSYSSSGVNGTAVGGTNLNIEFGTGTLSFVQFEWGTRPSYYEFRLNELQLCQRYLPTIIGLGPISSGWCSGATTAFAEVPHPVPPRVAPSGVFVSNASHFGVFTAAAAGKAVTGIAFNTGGIAGSRLTLTVGSGGLVAGNATGFTATSAAAMIWFLGCQL